MRLTPWLLLLAACGGGQAATKVSSYGTELTVETGVLGGVAPAPGKCSPTTRSYRVSLTTGAYHAGLCSASGDAYRVDRTLTSDELRSVEVALDDYTEAPQPSECLYDGTGYKLVVGTHAFLDEDYNCLHRDDVAYVSKGLSSFEGLLRSLAK